MIGGLLLAALAVPAPSAAAVAPSAPPAAATAGQRVVKLSPQGSDVVKQWSAQGDPGLQMLVQQQRELRTQMLALIGAPKIDVVKLEALMKKQEALQSDIRQRSDARRTRPKAASATRAPPSVTSAGATSRTASACA